MRRAASTLAGAAAGAVVLAAAWWWWTAPPDADAAALEAAAATVPAGADGLLVVGRPARAARWLLRRPQAAVLLAAAAPGTEGSFARLRAALEALAGEARGPLAVWWRGPDVALSAEVGEGAGRALRTLASLQGLPVRSRPTGPGAVTVAIASDGTLLDGPAGRRPATGAPHRLAALARVGPRWWRVLAARGALDLLAGDAPQLPPPGGASTVATADLGRLAALAGPPGVLPHVPCSLAFGPAGWALVVPGTALGPTATRLLTLGGDAPAAAPAGARRWRGVLGELWAAPGSDLTVASSAAMLAARPAPPGPEESGIVRGPELAAACLRAADAFDALLVLGPRAVALRRAAPAVAAVRLARWRIVAAGGTIRLEW